MIDVMGLIIFLDKLNGKGICIKTSLNLLYEFTKSENVKESRKVFIFLYFYHFSICIDRLNL